MIISIFDDFGKIPLCNRNPERALHIGDFVFPICYRCMMLGIGIFIGCIFFYILKEKKNMLFKFKHFILAIILIIPTFIDGLVQTLSTYESTNLRRSVTGLIAGLGISFLIIIILQFIEIKFMKFKTQKNL